MSRADIRKLAVSRGGYRFHILDTATEIVPKYLPSLCGRLPRGGWVSVGEPAVVMVAMGFPMCRDCKKHAEAHQ